MYRVLFVCTGNICRSPTAEAVFRHMVAAEGLEDKIEADSAGTHGYHIGQPPNARGEAVARRRGYKMDGLSARQFEANDFDDFDLIIAMDKGHYRILDTHRPHDGKAKIEMMMAYAQKCDGEEVPDPYYGDEKDYIHALDLIEDAAQGLLQAIQMEKN